MTFLSHRLVDLGVTQSWTRIGCIHGLDWIELCNVICVDCYLNCVNPRTDSLF